MPKPMDRASPVVKAVIETVFPGIQVAIAQCTCPQCGQPIDPSRDFRTTLSEKEYYLSGLCQNCQDRVFDA